MDVFKAGHLVLDNQLVCSFFPGKTTSPLPAFLSCGIQAQHLLSWPQSSRFE